MQRFLTLYACVLSTALAVFVLVRARTPKVVHFDDVSAQRIDIVEPNGTLRMVISDHARLPGIIVRGHERPFARPQAGMLFYNDEGSENGGLIFGGYRNAKGEVIDSGGSLSFDKYGASQIVQFAGVDDKDDRFAGMRVNDKHRRVWVGRDETGAAALALMDQQGRKRILLQVTADGTPSMTFLGPNGEIVDRVLPRRP